MNERNEMSKEYRDSVRFAQREAFWTIGKIIPVGIVAVVAMVILAFTLELGGLKWDMFFKPKHAAVERKVFEETQSYVHGKIQDLAKYKREYDAMTSPNDQTAMRAIINQQFAQFDKDKIVDRDLRNFLIQMRGF